MKAFFDRLDSGEPLTLGIVVLALALICAVYGIVLMMLDARAAKRELERRRAYQPPTDPIGVNLERHLRSLGRHP